MNPNEPPQQTPPDNSEPAPQQPAPTPPQIFQQPPGGQGQPTPQEVFQQPPAGGGVQAGQAPPTGQQPPAGGAPPPGGGLRFGAMGPEAYWRKNILCVLALLIVWFAVSFGCGILFADQLDASRTPGGGVKLGFWFGQQGSIFVFVLLIGIYVMFMNRLDRKFRGGGKS